MENKNNFWFREIDSGYYEKILIKGLLSRKGLQSNWHNNTFIKMKSYLKKGLTHLDYACGPGSLIGNYSDSNSIGFDIVDKQIQYAKNKYENNNKSFTSEKSNIQLVNYFDVITINGLFEYLTNEEIINLLNELKMYLKRNGVILITTPNYFGIFRFIEKIGRIIGGVDYSKVNINKFNKRKVKSLLKNLDCEKFEVSKFMNLGIIFSIFSHSFGSKVENLIDKIFFGFFGMILFIKIYK